MFSGGCGFWSRQCDTGALDADFDTYILCDTIGNMGFIWEYCFVLVWLVVGEFIVVFPKVWSFGTCNDVLNALDADFDASICLTTFVFLTFNAKCVFDLFFFEEVRGIEVSS